MMVVKKTYSILGPGNIKNKHISRWTIKTKGVLTFYFQKECNKLSNNESSSAKAMHQNEKNG